MSGNGKRGIIVILATLLAAGAAAAGFVLSGVYNVAATEDHTAVTRGVLHILRERSVAARAKDLPELPAADSQMVAHGFEHYRAMCVACHGAPGVERGEFGRGMTPTPPDLAEEAAELSPRELFWITKHGIKLAGMPAFGPTHSDEEIRGIVAFLERLPHMSAEEYQAWEARLAVADSAGETGHTHAPGTSSHEH